MKVLTRPPEPLTREEIERLRHFRPLDLVRCRAAIDGLLATLDAERAAREPMALRKRIEAVIAEHESDPGYARYGGDALLRDIQAALASGSAPAEPKDDRTPDQIDDDLEAMEPGNFI